MGRPVRLRTGGYASDATALSRLALALKSDARIPKARIKELVTLLDRALDLLLEVDRGLGLSNKPSATP
jgi:hypothetical protein